MLVHTMSDMEVTAEIKKDFEKLSQTTIPRLADEYERERKKLKINAARTYTRVYPIRSGKKNNWFFFLRKAPSHEIFKSQKDIQTCSVTYYYNKKGLRAFSLTNTPMICVYNGHFFTRYNERLHLNLTCSTDIIKHYFKQNCYRSHKLIEKNERFFVIGFYDDGLELGEIRYDMMWLVNNTFVSKELFFPEQNETEKEAIANLKQELEQALLFKNTSEAQLEIYKEKLQVISGQIMH